MRADKDSSGVARCGQGEGIMPLSEDDQPRLDEIERAPATR
jgi:hypothetical protein